MDDLVEGIFIPEGRVINKIFPFRGLKVIMDKDPAEL